MSSVRADVSSSTFKCAPTQQHEKIKNKNKIKQYND